MSNPLEALKAKLQGVAEQKPNPRSQPGQLSTATPNFDSIINQLQPSLPLNARLLALRDLTSLFRDIPTPINFISIWDIVEPLATSSASLNARTAVIDFAAVCAEKDLEALSPLRLRIATLLSVEVGAGDSKSISNGLRLLRSLTKDGRDMRDLQNTSCSLLSSWLYLLEQDGDDNNDGGFVGIVSFARNVLIFSSVHLNEDQVSAVIRAACHVGRARLGKSFKEVFTLIDTAVSCSSLPRSVIGAVVECLADAASVNSLADESWECLRNLLNSYRSHATFASFCSLLDIEPPEAQSRNKLLPGVMRLLRRTCRETPFEAVACSNMYILAILQRVASVENDVVEYETLQCVKSVLSANQRDLTVVEWDVILEIVGTLGRCWSTYGTLAREKGLMLGTPRPGAVAESQAASVLMLHNELVVEVEAAHPNKIVHPSMSFFESLIPFIPLLADPLAQTVLTSFADRVCQYEDWIFPLKSLFNSAFYAEERTTVRTGALTLVTDLSVAAELSEQQRILDEIVLPLLKHLPMERDLAVMQATLKLLAGWIMDGDVEHCLAVLDGLMAAISSSRVPPSGAESREEHKPIVEGPLRLLIEVFICNASNRPEQGCLQIFRYLISASKNAEINPTLRSLSISFLSDLRANSLGFVLLPRLPDWSPQSPPSSQSGQGPQAEEFAGILRGGAGNGSAGRRTRLRIFGDHDGATAHDHASMEADDGKQGEAVVGREGGSVHLPIGEFLDAVTSIVTREIHWDVYWTVLTKLTPQLYNVSLFKREREGLGRLRTVICELIHNEKAGATVTNLPPRTRKTDVYLLAFKIVTALLGYRSHFPKPQQDEMLQTFLVGLNRWPNLAKYCMHALTLALAEMPSNMVKLLSSTLLKVSQTMSATLGVHNLEFLSSLAHAQHLCVNFTEADFKRIFGVALQYIHSPPSIHADATPAVSATSQYIVLLAYQVLSIWFISLRIKERRKYVPFILHYLLLSRKSHGAELDENVQLVLDLLVQNTYVDCWPKPPDTPAQIGRNEKTPPRTWIHGNALLTIRLGEQEGWCEVRIRRPTGVVSLHVNLENRLKLPAGTSVTLPAPLSLEGTSLKRTKSVGSGHSRSGSFGSITEGFGGSSSMGPAMLKTMRSASISSIGEFDLQHSDTGVHDSSARTSSSATFPATPRLSDNPSEGGMQPFPLRRGRSLSLANPSSKIIGVTESIDSNLPGPPTSPSKREDQSSMDPSFLILQLLSYPNTDPTATPKPLPTDDATNRAVSVLDRTPLVDLHKIGVVYAAPGQTEEAEILFNCAGSRFYGLFLQSLGRLVRLKGCREVYTGGLDTSDDVDGKYAVYSQDHLSQTIFHCTTLMPSPEHDPLSTGKKRHIGNDFITIIWNESGLPFAFDTIPAQFNFVNIIIEPVGSMNEKGIGVVKQYNEHMFKAYAQFREDMPEVGALWDPKLISGAALGSFVKQTAVQCNIFAQIFWQCVSGNMYTSNARERLRQINRMKNRVVANAPERPGSAGGGDAGSGVGQGLDLNVLLDFSRFT